MTASRIGKLLLIFLLFTVFALFLTLPLPWQATTHIPQGSEGVGTVPLFNLWTLQWNISQMMEGYPTYWDAPIFAPQPGTFAFSESQPLSGLLAGPIWLGFQSPALAYNFLIWLFLTLNGWFAYWLLRQWQVSGLTAALTGLLVQALPFVAQEMGVLQLLAIFGLLWSLLFVSRLLQPAKPTWRSVIALAIGTPLTFFTCGYYGLFSIFFLPLSFLIHWRREHISITMGKRLFIISILILGLSGPFLFSQQQRLAEVGFTRSAQTIQNNSARLVDYANFLDYNLLYGQIFQIDGGQGQRLFPGLGLIFLASLGLIGLTPGRPKLYLLLAIVLALLLSGGLRLNLEGIQPYQWVRDTMPGFAQLRSPFRFAVFLQLHLALLAGLGLENLGRWHLTRYSPAVLLLASFALFESLALPLPLQAVPKIHPPALWQQWLNEQPPPRRIIILPFAEKAGVAHFEQTTRWMLQSHQLQGDMVNGYSGFFPRNHAQLRKQMLAFPTPTAIQFLQRLGVRYVVVHEALPNTPPSSLITPFLPIVYQNNQTQVTIYEIGE